ncbi:hypothetical protein [Lutibacter sp. B1]|uniref:hypothetical protein n=1 Tax=Lutibacter sp. B1 TaxID=2725996 RepID=UPI001456ABEA|nr:hypothetical protein [Lutibacter sp. B1]NLP57152.1 hypothetical protein [Lutibacter sp. B1]
MSLFFVNGHIQAIDIDGNGIDDLCYKKLPVVEETCPEKNNIPLNVSLFSDCNYTNLEIIKIDGNSNYVVREEITLIIAILIHQ